MLIAKLLPHDTHSIELISTLSFFLLALSTIFLPQQGVPHHEIVQCAFIFLMIGFLQIIGILFEHLNILRISLAYVSGIIWFWFGTSMLTSYSALAYCASVSIALAIGNFYAFVIGVSFLVKKKKEQDLI